jgi:osmotically-inducible protein OsmY
MKYLAAMKRLYLCGLACVALLAWNVGDTFEAQGSSTGADQLLKENVQKALSSDPYFYEVHVNVLVEYGNVVLRGFVFSDWDLRTAIRIATKASGGRRVIDDLTIEVGGRR